MAGAENFSTDQKWKLAEKVIKDLRMDISFSAERLFNITRGEIDYGCREIFSSPGDFEEVLEFAFGHGWIMQVNNGSMVGESPVIDCKGKFALVGAKIPRYNEDGMPPGGSKLCQQLAKLHDYFDGESVLIGKVKPAMAGCRKKYSLRKIITEAENLHYVEIVNTEKGRNLRWLIDPSEFLPVD